MPDVSAPQAVAGVLLLFVLPGLTTAKALFPEWRLRGPERLLRSVELGTLSLVLSVGYTVLLGFGLLNLPVGFSAAWSDPLLEELLAIVTLGGFIVGWARGAYRKEPPPAPAPETSPGEDGAWEVVRSLEILAREERRIRHALRVDATGPTAAGLRAELDRVQAETRRLGDERGALLAE
ncbi:MAG TPA: hypothetical protein VIZ68_01975 [Thermoplasmata archaeon]